MYNSNWMSTIPQYACQVKYHHNHHHHHHPQFKDNPKFAQFALADELWIANISTGLSRWRSTSSWFGRRSCSPHGGVKSRSIESRRYFTPKPPSQCLHRSQPRLGMAWPRSPAIYLNKFPPNSNSLWFSSFGGCLLCNCHQQCHWQTHPCGEHKNPLISSVN